MEILRIWPAELSLGEGATWHAASRRFFFVDIHGCAVHAWTPETGQRQSWPMPERVGWLIARTDGQGFVAGFQSGFVHLELEPTLRINPMGSPHAGKADVRMNDAKADCYGRIWAGSMNNRDPGQADGQLVRLDTDGTFVVLERGIHIANGPCIREDGARMWHTDSFLDCIYSYQVSAAGAISGKQEWKRFDGNHGTPDGMTLDAQGHVWVAFWGGACIRQFSVQGDLLQQIDLPALQITNVAFGGDDLQTLIVTSARTGLTQAQLDQYPDSGAVFALRPGATGVLPHRYG